MAEPIYYVTARTKDSVDRDTIVTGSSPAPNENAAIQRVGHWYWKNRATFEPLFTARAIEISGVEAPDGEKTWEIIVHVRGSSYRDAVNDAMDRFICAMEGIDRK